MNKYIFTPAMREISGFGGTYEAGCRAMVVRGALWLHENPTAKPEFTILQNIFGYLKEENKAAEELAAAMCKAGEEVSGGAPTAAMMQACVGHVLHIAKIGWGAYVTEMEALKV